MRFSWKGLFLVLVIISSFAFFGYFAYLNMGAKSRASSSTAILGNDDISSPDSSLVAAWGFNQTSGTTAFSRGSCGAACNGTLTNFAYTGSRDAAVGTGWTTNRLWGTGALMLDGNNDYVTTPLPMSTFANGFTWSAWVKTNNVSGGRSWIFASSKTAGVYPWFECGKVDNKGDIRFDTGDFAVNKVITSSGTNIADGNWHYIACVWDKVNSRKSIYIDGTEKAASTIAIANNTSADYGSLTIGNRPGAGENWKGTIDFASVYSRALTANEILANYQGQNGNLTPTPTPSTNNLYSNLSASLGASTASYSFTYTGSPTTNFSIHSSDDPKMLTNVYIKFAQGSTSPISQNNPTMWNGYSCGRTLYWVVTTEDLSTLGWSSYNPELMSPIVSSTVTCP